MAACTQCMCVWMCIHASAVRAEDRASHLSQWHLCLFRHLGQKSGHHPQLSSFSLIPHPNYQQMLLAPLSKCIQNPTITLHLHYLHPGPATISLAWTIMVASFLVSPPPALPLHCLLSTHSQGDPIITAVRSCHSPVLPCILGIKHQLLSTAWPKLLLRSHLPPLSSGSPCFHHTGLLTVPPPCSGHTSTSGPLQILFPVPGTFPADTHMVHSLIQIPAQRSPPQGDRPDYPSKTTALLHVIPSPYSVAYFLSIFPPLKC